MNTDLEMVKQETERLTFLSEFTGAEWPAFLNDISHSRYTPVIAIVNRQFFKMYSGELCHSEAVRSEVLCRCCYNLC